MSATATVDKSVRMAPGVHFITGTIAFADTYDATDGELVVFGPAIEVKVIPQVLFFQRARGFHFEWTPTEVDAGDNGGRLRIFGQEPTSLSADVIALSELPDASDLEALIPDPITFFAIYFA